MFENCNTYGNVNSKNISYFFGNTGNSMFIDSMKLLKNNNKKIDIKVNNSYNYGAIYGTSNVSLLTYNSDVIDYLMDQESSLMSKINKGAGDIRTISSTNNIKYIINDDYSIDITKSQYVEKHFISYSTYWKDDEGNHTVFSLNLEINDNQKNYYAYFVNIKNSNTSGYELIENNPRVDSNSKIEYFVAKKDGKVYYLFNNIENYIYNTGKNPTLNATQYPSIRIQGFDSSNKLIDYTIVTK